MYALITSADAQAFTLTLQATDTDQAIFEIVQAHRDVLLQCGLSDDWLNANALDEDELDKEPQWDAHVRLFGWWACYTDQESDDAIVAVHIIDGSRIQASDTGYFLDANSACMRFDLDAGSDESFKQATYDRIRLGLTDCTEDAQACFSAAWVADHESQMPPVQQLAPGIRFCEWHSDRGYEDWRHLRLYVFDNRPPATILPIREEC